MEGPQYVDTGKMKRAYINKKGTGPYKRRQDPKFVQLILNHEKIRVDHPSADPIYQ